MAATITALPGATGSTGSPQQETARFSLLPGVGQTELLALIGVTAWLVYAYWQVFQETAIVWSQPQYSHGWIIPLIALFILWARRPDGHKGSEALSKVNDMAKPALGVLAAAGGVGYINGIGWLAGLGLSGACLMALAMCLAGQPFAAFGRGEKTTQFAEEMPLWVVTGVGSLIMLVALSTMPFSFRLPALHPGYYQVVGLAFLCLGGWVVSLTTETSPRAGIAEMVYGLAVVCLSLAAWAYGTGVDMMPLVRFSFITSLFGLFALTGGLRLIKWAGPSVGFLVFMFPLPSLIEGKVLPLLQRVAVMGSEVVFTLIGTRVSTSGNKLEVEGIPMEVIEACSGLSMSTILVAMAIAMALIINRPWWDKAIVVLSSVPIALVANIFRIVATGLLWIGMDQVMTMDAETTAGFRDQVHNLAGILLMMPFALGLYWLEFKLLSMLSVEEEGLETQGAGVIGRGGAPMVR